MPRLPRILLLSLIALTFTSCFKDQDDSPVASKEINDFVWKGLNAFYLYKDNVADLADTRFNSDSDYLNYLSSYPTPEDLFYSLLYNRNTEDRFSWITDDYIALEQQFNGQTATHGMEYGLVRFSNSNNVFGYVRYVLPNTDAELKGVERGYLFNRVDGEHLYYNSSSDTNINLLSGSSYQIGLAVYNDLGTTSTADDTIESIDEEIQLTKSEYTENPIYIDKVLEVNGHNIGYLMYNGFTGTDTFDSQLNSVFGTFKSEGVSDLVLDLRYNPGGSVRTATWLASMITGQFTGDVFVKEQWNSDWQSYFESQNPEALLIPFTDVMEKQNSNNSTIFKETINSLHLNKVYVLTTQSTASASELIINGLKPYIDVIQIGDVTTGKYQASRTLYDSPDFTKSGINPTHTYAMQPLIFKSLNANGVTDYFDGLTPTIAMKEYFGNLGVLGDYSEPLLQVAIAQIAGTDRVIHYQQELNYDYLSNSKALQPLPNAMYLN